MYNRLIALLIGLLLVTSITLIAVSSAHAATTKLKVNIEGGSLSLSSPEIASLSAVSLDNAVKTISGKLGTISVVDSRGSGTGWAVTMTVSDFTCCNNQYKIGVNNLTVNPSQVQTVLGSSTNVVSGSSHTFTSTSDIATIISASSGAGMGNYEINPELGLLVPANTYAGEYSATLTLTII